MKNSLLKVVITTLIIVVVTEMIGKKSWVTF